MKTSNIKTELLAPAGDLERAYIALDYGADAIFLGGKAFSLRAHASNFDISDIDQIIKYAHSKNKKVYIVTNIICHNPFIKSAYEYIKKLVDCNPDGFITADPFLVSLINKNFPNAEIHISTQQSICNSKAALFWKRNNVKRIVLAREVTYEELKQLMDNLKQEIEVEIFIHGAVCISYSGRCTMSNNFSLRDANTGGCAQSCRWKYLVENNDIYKKDKYFTMSAKDMSQITNIEELLKLNIASFKIEGRMKSLHYVATVVNSYRKVIDNYYNNLNLEINKNNEELSKAANRETDTAWFDSEPNKNKMLYHDVEKKVNQNYAFIIKDKENDYYKVITKNKISINDKIEIIGPNLNETIKTKIIAMKNSDNIDISVCPTPMSIIYLKFDSECEFTYPDIARLI